MRGEKARTLLTAAAQAPAVFPAAHACVAARCGLFVRLRRERFDSMADGGFSFAFDAQPRRQSFCQSFLRGRANRRSAINAGKLSNACKGWEKYPFAWTVSWRAQTPHAEGRSQGTQSSLPRTQHCCNTGAIYMPCTLSMKMQASVFSSK